MKCVVIWEHFDRSMHVEICDDYAKAKEVFKELKSYAENHNFAEEEDIVTNKKNGVVCSIRHERVTSKGIETLRIEGILEV